MKNALKVAIVTAVALALASPAAASHGSWSFGAGFQVGGVHFQIGYQELGGGWGHPHFRVGVPLAQRGYACSDACNRVGGSWYHHHSCPLVRHHFQLYGYEPWGLIGAHAPPAVPFVYRGPRAYGYPGPYGYRSLPSPYFYYRAPSPYVYRYDRRGYKVPRYRYDSRHRDRHYRDRWDRDHRDRWDRDHHDRDWDRDHRGRGRGDDRRHRWDD